MRERESNDIVVYFVRRDSACADCGSPLPKGSALTMSDGQPLCLECADLDHLVMLRAGNASLTRRAKKYTGLWAVVVKWSRSRKRYERQGLLVEEEALVRAEAECLSETERAEWTRYWELDAPAKEKRSKALAKRLRERYPKGPKAELERVAHTVCHVYQVRIGKAAEDGTLTDDDLRLAVLAYLRHAHTNYDELRLSGQDRDPARAAVAEEVAELERAWEGA